MRFPSKQAIKQALIRAKEGQGGGGANSIWPFTREVGQGDIVVANDGLSRAMGVGVVTSGYLPPEHPHNPNSKEETHRHARLVHWIVDKPIDLGERLFSPPTVQRLNSEQFDTIVRIYLKEYPNLEKTFDTFSTHKLNVNRFGPAAEETQSPQDSEYAVGDNDVRESAWNLIKVRRGQGKFRSKLLQRYGQRCLVTGCKLVAVLEAEHIDPYLGEGHNHPGNDLLLRADIHTLFDLELLGVSIVREFSVGYFGLLW